MRIVLLALFLSISSPAWALLQTMACGNVDQSLSATQVRYANCTFGNSWNATIANRQCLIPHTSTFSDLRISLDADPDNGAGTQSYAFAIMDGGSATALTTTVSQGSTSNADTTNAVSIAAGSLFSIRSTPANTPTVTNATWSLQRSSPDNVSISCGGSADTAISTVANTYLSPAFDGTDSSSSGTQLVVPEDGTALKMYASVTTAPNTGAGTQEWVITVRKNDAATSMTCTISEAGTACNDVTNTFTFVAGDLINIEFAPSVSAPASTIAQVGMAFRMNRDGAYFISSHASAIDPAAPSYIYANANRSDTPTEGNRDQITDELYQVRTLYAQVDTAPDNGAGTQTWTFDFRANGADAGPTGCVISEAETSCSAMTITRVARGQKIDIEATPANTPVATNVETSVLIVQTRPRMRRY